MNYTNGVGVSIRTVQEANNDPMVPMTFSVRLTKKNLIAENVGTDKKYINKSELVNAALDMFFKKNYHLK